MLLYIPESGFLPMNMGCLDLEELDRTPDRTRHQCALLCLSDVECVLFSYLYTENPPVCVRNRNTCKIRTKPNVHSYLKGKFQVIQED